MPAAGWSAEELERRARLGQGVAVAVNMRRRSHLIAWANERGLFVRVDRTTPWGNPYVLGTDGDRATASDSRVTRSPASPGDWPAAGLVPVLLPVGRTALTDRPSASLHSPRAVVPVSAA